MGEGIKIHQEFDEWWSQRELNSRLRLTMALHDRHAIGPYLVLVEGLEPPMWYTALQRQWNRLYPTPA